MPVDLITIDLAVLPYGLHRIQGPTRFPALGISLRCPYCLKASLGTRHDGFAVGHAQPKRHTVNQTVPKLERTPLFTCVFGAYRVWARLAFSIGRLGVTRNPTIIGKPELSVE